METPWEAFWAALGKIPRWQVWLVVLSDVLGVPVVGVVTFVFHLPEALRYLAILFASVVTCYVVYRAGAIAWSGEHQKRTVAESALDDRERRRQTGVQLAAFYAQGDLLQEEILNDSDETHPPEWKKKTEEWIRRVLLWANAELSPAKAAYIFRGRTATIDLRLPLEYKGRQIPPDKRTLIEIIELRMRRIEEMLKDY
jgi:hypothetical protein